MSNFLAVATVTESLRQLLDDSVHTVTSAASATAVRPGATTGGGATALPNPGVNIYLYQVSPNAAWRNMDLPNRRDEGSLANRPRAALDLHYLLTFHGQDNQLEPQRLLGRVIQVLHSQPVLTRQRIRSTVASTAFLASSNLAEEVELVKFSLVPLSLEELSKLWSVFFQSAYVLSLAYHATVVLIEGDEAPRNSLPVRDRSLRVLPFQRPFIEQVEPQIIEPSGTLIIRGQNLKADIVKAQFGSASAVPSVVSSDKLSVVLPASLAAGINTLQVAQFLDFNTGSPSEPHRLFESNVAAFIVTPKITVPAGPLPRGTDLTISIVPPVARSQDVKLLLGDQSVTLPPRPVSDPPNAVALKFPIPKEFPTGDFLVRLQVDGAQSKLTEAADGTYTGPKIAIVCTADCLRSANIALSVTASGVQGVVTAEDGTGAFVNDAEVSVTWTLPDGSTLDDVRKTVTPGEATFTIIGGNGKYVLTVTGLTKAGLAFDQQPSTLSQSIVK